MRKKDKKKIMQQNEILERLTKHARGYTSEECLNVIGIGDHCSEVVKTSKKITPKDQIKALELIQKRYFEKEKFIHQKNIDEKKIEFEERKLNKDTTDSEVEDDGFVEALGIVTEEIWEDVENEDKENQE